MKKRGFGAINENEFFGENKFYTLKEACDKFELGIGRNTLFKKLREKGILDDYNTPINERTNHFFKSVDNRYETILISKKGIDFIIKNFIQNNN